MDLRLILAATATEPTWLDTLGSYAWIIFSIGAGLGFVIFVHELGHFLVAKMCGVKVEKFYVGFDWFPISRIGPFKIPHSLFKAKWGETVYGVGILPLGGYVKMLGQDDDPRNAAAEAERAKALKEGTAAEGHVPGQSVEAATQAGMHATEAAAFDPRSYPAKSVPARMAIISAGVIMNVIFAVVLAAIAYKLGVEEMPAMIGATVPGDPAWVAGLQPGDKILQFGKSGQPYEHLRFDDLRRSVIFNGADRDLPMLVRHRTSKEEWFVIRPVKKPGAKFGTLGVAPAYSAKLGVSTKDDPVRAATSPPIVDEDLVVAVEGRSIASGTELAMELAQHFDKPLTITVERTLEPETGVANSDLPKKQRLDVVVHPRSQRYLGATMKMGPIVAIQKDSPAEAAGIKVGDVIENVDDQDAGDPLSLDQRLVSKAGQQVKFTVRRQEGKIAVSKDFTMTVSAPHTLLPLGGFSGLTELEGIGVAYRVLNVVAAVDPNTPAATEGLQPGDDIKVVEFVSSSDEAKKNDALVLGVKVDELKPFTLDDETHTWSFVHRAMQGIDAGTKLKLTYSRDGKTRTTTVGATENPTLYDESRGLGIYSYTEMHEAKTWGNAFQLGLRETKERLSEVLTVLMQLGSGRISATNLSGPAGILGAAGSHAAAGIAPLLLFLTLLSANLAIINFLPIPALDGGHMLFLAAEWIRGKPVDANLQGWLSMIGVLCLLSLMVFATVMDIGRFMS